MNRQITVNKANLIQNIEEEVTFKENDHVFISLNNLITFPSPKLILFYILQKYGLNRTQSDNLFEAETGAVIQSKKLIFLKNRTEIVIKNRSTKRESKFEIALYETPYNIGKLRLLSMSKVDLQEYNNSEEEIFVDANKIKLPLLVRHRKEADSFYPLGMDMKSKKVKKYFIDIKLNQFEKEEAQLLVDAEGDTIWVMGYRADERFKIDENTTEIIRFKIGKHSG